MTVCEPMGNPYNNRNCQSRRPIMSGSFIYKLNMTIFQRIRRAIDLAKYRIALLFKGQSYSAAESSLIFQKQHATKHSLTLKMHQYPELNTFFIWFLNSAAVGGRVTGDNLTFVIGGEGVGKTYFLERAIEQFLKLKAEKKGVKPQIHRYLPPEYFQYLSRCQSFDNEHSILLSFNFKETPLLNFQGLVESIQERIICEMVRLNSSLGERLLDAQVVKDVVLSEWAEEYMFIYLKDVVYCMINGTDPLLLNQSSVQLLQQLNETIKVMEPHQFFTSQKYGQLVNIVSQGVQISMVEAAIRLFVSTARRIEYQQRSEAYRNSWFVSGIQSMDVLLDLLNFLCGFGSFNRSAVCRYFSGVPHSPNQTNWIKAGNRIDVGLCLMNLDSLNIWQSQLLSDWVDHIVCRTAGANGIRTHFPIVIQLPSAADVEDLLSMGQFQIGTVPFIQIPGYLNHSLLKSGLSKVFAPKILARMFYSLGKCPESWSKALVDLGSGTDLQNIIKGKAQFIQKEGIRCEARFNRVFTSLEAQPYLADGSIREELAQHLRFLQKGRGMVVLDRPGYYIQFVTRPLFQALQREGLAYHSFYLPHLDLCQLVYFHKLVEIKNRLLKGNMRKFIMWRWRNRHRYSMLRYQIAYKETFELQSQYYDKFVTFRTENQLSQTYYGPGFNYLLRYSKFGVHERVHD